MDRKSISRLELPSDSNFDHCRDRWCHFCPNMLLGHGVEKADPLTPRVPGGPAHVLNNLTKFLRSLPTAQNILTDSSRVHLGNPRSDHIFMFVCLLLCFLISGVECVHFLSST